MTASPFLAPGWLRNRHAQSLLASSPMRGARGRMRLQQAAATHQPRVLDVGDGVRLHGIASLPATQPPRAMALLLHGWEGSAESSYMRLTAAQLLHAGLAVFRLNFRDHGNSHHLNEGVFHSNRLDEVVAAAGTVAKLWPDLPLVVAGYSLGGNFALRLALRAPAAGLPLQGVAAVCPLLDPAGAMDQMETGPAFYLRYFERKWRQSLARKRALFPHAHTFGNDVLQLPMRALTAWMVHNNTDFADLEAYFNGYCIAGDRLQALQLPVHVLMAEDDPVIPLAQFHRIATFPMVSVELARHGGHCGFIEGASLDGYAERWVADKLTGASAA
ncbi:MAG TPA: alpha/beta fold hydrolase [Thermomonas sp.]|nr:alpha/beta fold hydrolase [Thermomonas sp.]